VSMALARLFDDSVRAGAFETVPRVGYGVSR